MADDLKPIRDRRCCADTDTVQRAANDRAEQEVPEWKRFQPETRAETNRRLARIERAVRRLEREQAAKAKRRRSAAYDEEADLRRAEL